MNVSIPYETFRNEIYLPVARFLEDLEHIFACIHEFPTVPEKIVNQLTFFRTETEKRLAPYRSLLGNPTKYQSYLRLEMTQHEWEFWAVLGGTVTDLQNACRDLMLGVSPC